MKEFLVPMTPVPKPRMTQRDKWLNPPRPPVLRYRAFEERLYTLARASHFEMPESGASIHFAMPMPCSWSKKKREAMRGQPHQQRPDLDNLIKAVFDALLGEDCKIWQLKQVEKRWCDVGYFTITPIE